MNLFACNLSVSNQFLELSFFAFLKIIHIILDGRVVSGDFHYSWIFEGKSVIKFLDTCQMKHFIVPFVTCVFE